MHGYFDLHSSFGNRLYQNPASQFSHELHGVLHHIMVTVIQERVHQIKQSMCSQMMQILHIPLIR